MDAVNTNYLVELKSEHRTIGRRLEEIKGFIQTRNIQDISIHLDVLKESLLAHFKKEGDKIYGELLNAVKDKDIKLAELTVSAFSGAMKGMENRIFDFFTKYSHKDEIAGQMTEFHYDFQMFYEDILKRVASEEKVIYPIYEKHCC
ncbi:MAG: hemerythrin domain-containing protein [Deltaproteobacteria bacterium]|nr:hemerythrin domain-containing protein [Deltaproteobacteria bacterium]